jgi:hypothetical protein
LRASKRLSPPINQLHAFSESLDSVIGSLDFAVLSVIEGQFDETSPE